MNVLTSVIFGADTFSKLPALLFANGLVQTFEFDSDSLLDGKLSISAEKVGLAGIIGDRQQTLSNNRIENGNC